VDKKLAPLLQKIWALNISTQWSCQGNISSLGRLGELGYIMVKESRESRSLIETLRREHDGFASAYSYIWDVDEKTGVFEIPEELLSSSSFGIEEDHREKFGPRFCIRFPPSAIPSLERLLDRYSLLENS
jgi:hypothetical protein